MNDLQCPKCKSETITQIGDDLLCLKCGLRENLYDYPCHDPRWEMPEETTIEPKVEIIDYQKIPDKQLQQVHARLNYLTKEVQLIRNSNRKRKEVFKYD